MYVYNVYSVQYIQRNLAVFSAFLFPSALATRYRLKKLARAATLPFSFTFAFSLPRARESHLVEEKVQR